MTGHLLAAPVVWKPVSWRWLCTIRLHRRRSISTTPILTAIRLRAAHEPADADSLRAVELLRVRGTNASLLFKKIRTVRTCVSSD